MSYRSQVDSSQLSAATATQRRVTPALLALSCIGFVASAGSATAQDAAAEEGQGNRLGGVTVTDTAIDESYNRTDSASPKLMAPLLDTPRSVTVISRELIENRGLVSLTDVLRVTPGVTLGAGEGGTPVGDRAFVRGYEASTDIQIDGLRDVARFSHEIFNLESVELIKGAGGALAGRGSTGGSINLVTKTPKAGDFIAVAGTVGTDETKRLTADINQQLSDSIAVRVNLMGHDADVAGRDVSKVSRWGIAPSIIFGLGGPTRATASYLHLATDDLPDFGLPFNASGSLVTPPKVRRENFYGFANRDFRKTVADVGTLWLEQDLGTQITLRNATRVVRTTNEYILTRPSFTGTNTASVNRDLRSSNRLAKGILNQTDLRGRFNTGGIEHAFIGGVEYSKERIYARTAWTEVAGQPAYPTPLLNPDPYSQFRALQKVPPAVAADPTRFVTKAAFLFDTISLSNQLDINLGLRYDDYKATSSGGATAHSKFWNYQAGVVYKPVEYGSIYASFSTSSNPSGETEGQSGGADGAAGGGVGGGRANLDPERAKSYELGTKWDLFDQQLSLTAAIFRTEKTNARANDPVSGTIQLIGHNRVQGFEISATGNITPAWDIVAGYTYLDAKLIDDAQAPATSNNGNVLKFVAPHSFSIWTTYDVTPDFNLGGGVNYVGRRFVNDDNTLRFNPYARFDLTASYKVSDNLDLRLNIQNLTDKTIFDASHVGLFAVVAPGRSALFSASLRY
ncbi:TonB-dependent siderophore receptor [Sphingomonas sp. SCN 67-18]|uniref:TonB-dependent receptor n=1 Tax=uncultured Sphingomonas sp. TaxID=158754 RepID=UPI000AFAEA40|nr:TonB-dependent siderophore receptor [Sphingomonas sp. SCN 67-18]